MKRKVLLVLCLAGALSLLSGFLGCAAEQPAAPAEPTAAPASVLPVIKALTADKQVPPLGKTTLVCEASEPGVDSLTYNWAATGGAIAGSGSQVEWSAPEKSGDYAITVVVNDPGGQTAKKTVIVNVPAKPNTAPAIEALKVTRPDHNPLTVKTQMTDAEKKKLPELVIRKYETAEISCIASDPDNDKLDYVWQATGGKLQGNGPNILWIAAGEPGLYTITAEVSDNNGGVATFPITIKVICCSNY